MTDERLAEIEEQCKREASRGDEDGPVEYLAHDDALELIAEVRRLRSLLAEHSKESNGRP